MVRFRIGWWFKNLGKGSHDPITYIILNIAKRCKDNTKVKLSKMKAWIPPPAHILFFNVDGSTRGSPGQAGIEGVLRDNGNTLCMLSYNIGIEDAITVEIQAIAKACNLRISKTELVGKRIVFVSDSKSTVSWVNSDNLGSLKHLHYILDIRSSLESLRKVFVEFSSRSSNSAADALAKQGSGGGEDSFSFLAGALCCLPEVSPAVCFLLCFDSI
ncbi:hypothetical protein Dsin_028056 [Dipteronia sinensis]|uniref:RNase H type-1 domain-containing protein n=1 Tax=Dipteronia sinensis TaxID=43782 RepID=A0AAD9ZQI5_9ROSI|nr:hypothetical protein Dsin_028056 [Dipteronia sinensis]